MIVLRILMMYTANAFIKMGNTGIPINHSIQIHLSSNDTTMHFVCQTTHYNFTEVEMPEPRIKELSLSAK